MPSFAPSEIRLNRRLQAALVMSSSRALTFIGGLYIALLLLSPPLLRQFEFVSRGIRADQLLLLGTAMLLAVVRTQWIWRGLRQRIAVGLALFLFCSALSVILSLWFVVDARLGVAVASFWGHTRILLCFLVGFAVACALPVAGHVRFMGWVVACSAVVAVIAIGQFIRVPIILEITSQYYNRKYNPDVVNQALSFGRVYGTFDGQPIFFGLLCAMMLIIVIAIWADDEWKRSRRLLIISAPALMLGLGLSWSRSAFACLFAGIGALVAFSGLRTAAKAIILLFLAGTVIYLLDLVPPVVEARILQLITLTDARGGMIYNDRLAYWSANLRFWREHPWFGVRGIEVPPYDSLYVALLTSSGGVGTAFFLASVCGAVASFARNGQRKPGLRGLSIGLICATVGLLVGGVGAPSFFGDRISELYWFLAGLVGGLLARSPSAYSPLSGTSGKGHLSVRVGGWKRPPTEAGGQGARRRLS